MYKILTFQHFGKELSKIMTHSREKCLKETGVSVEDVENCKNGEYKEDVKLKKYMSCLGITIGIVSKK